MTTDTLTTSIPGPKGTYWIDGFRGHDATMRFTIALVDDDGRTLLLENADWPTAFTFLGPLMRNVQQVESVLRSVCPVQHNDGFPDARDSSDG